MMVFRAKNPKGGYWPTFKLRITTEQGASAILSTGRTTEKDANKVEAAYKLWRGDDGDRFAQPELLTLLVEKVVTLADAYTAHQNGSLAELVASAKARLAAVVEEQAAREAEAVRAAADPDLRPHVELWGVWKRKQRRGKGMAPEYRRQLERLYPTGQPFTLSLFSRRELKQRLEALPFDSPTRNRYKAAASSFGEYLLDLELIEVNPAKTIPGFGENPGRKINYAMVDAKRLIAGLPQPYAAIAATAYGFAAEWGAIEDTQAGDFALDANPPTMDVRGTKTANSRRHTRRRTVPLVKELRWLVPFIRPALKGQLPTARVFAGIPEWRALRTQKAIAAALGIVAEGQEEFGEHTLHDWRHSHAVTLLKLGYQPQIVADHLGHGDVDQVNRRYGLYTPTAHDYAATIPATSATRTRGKRNA